MLVENTLYYKLIIFVIFSHGYCKPEDNDDYPNIQDLFKMPRVDTGITLYTPPNIAAQVTINIDKLDVDKLRRKLELFPPSEDVRKLKTFRNFYMSYNATGNETVPINETRRYKVEHDWGWWLPGYRYWTHFGYSKNSRIAQCTKLMDICLQTIYMARHKIMLLEKEKHFNRKDTGYRIAFLYKHLRRLYRRLVDIYKTIKPELTKSYRYSWIYADYMTKFHQRTIRVYIDFLYYYWVMIEIDKEYRDRNNWKEPKGPDLEDINPTKDPRIGYMTGFRPWQLWGKK